MRFTKALRYDVEVTCVSPIRTSPGGRSSDEVLRRWDGTPIVQGTSLAGAMRAWKDDPVLFGKGEREGALTVSDLLFDGLQTTTRPRMRVNGSTGAADAGGKFDMAMLPSGTTGSFTLIWRGNDGQSLAQDAIEEYLCALNGGEICLGAQKSNGFGRISLQVRRRAYDLRTEIDRRDWLEGVADGAPIALQEKETMYVKFQVRAMLPAVLVKAKAGTGGGEIGASVVHYSENGKFVVPGSSIKGAVRAQIVRFAPYLGAEDALDRLFGRRSGKENSGIAGKIRFGDGHYEAPKETGKITRIRIDRFTGGVIRRHNYSVKNLCGTLCWEITVPVAENLGCGLMLYALRDLGFGLYTLGSGSGIGCGRAEALEVQILAPDGSASLSCQDGAVTWEDPDGIIARWRKALGGVEA